MSSTLPVPRLRSFGFQSYLCTQFLGAFNDNLIKLIVIFTALEVFPSEGSRHASLASLLFLLPFLLFSGWAGLLADRHSKRSVMVSMKVLEVAVMGLAFFFLAGRNLPGLYLVLFLMGIHSTFFGPSKYGILPEILPDKELSRANGFLEMTTFMAIVLGTSLGGFLFARWHDQPHLLGGVLLGIALVGLVASRGIPRVPAAKGPLAPSLNPFKGLWPAYKDLRSRKPLFLTVLGLSYFWFLGALIQLAVVLLGKETLALSEDHTALLGTALALGVGAGSLLAGRLSGEKVELGLVPLGSGGMGVVAVLLGLFPGYFPLTLALLGLMGFFGGFFAVPLNAYLQQKTAPSERGRFLALNNLLNTFGMILAAAFIGALGSSLHWPADRLIFVAGLLTIAATLYIMTILPEALVRFTIWVGTHSVYRIKVLGADKVPAQGPVLLVCNHVSHVDGLLVGSSLQREIRFMMWKPYTQITGLRWLFRLMNVIPTGNKTPRETAESILLARKALQNGEAVCIFAEGAISRTGNMHPFKRGFERIIEGLNVPVVPVHLDGLWGSVFSFKDGRFFLKWPQTIPYPVTLSFGDPLPTRASADHVRRAVMELGADAWEYRRGPRETLASRFLESVRHQSGRVAASDALGTRLSFARFGAASFLLARWLRSRRPNEGRIGILLPPSVAGAMANAACALAGRCSVNLNFSLGPETTRLMCEKAGLQTVLTSRRFLEKGSLPTPEGAVFLEDLITSFGVLPKIAALLAVWLLPPSWTLRLTGGATVRRDAPATLLFSRGSTAVPKGVVLSHHNILSNMEAFGQVFWVSREDILAGVLPFFHSFGLTTTLWFPLLLGFRVAYHPNPLDAKAVGELVRKERATFLLATPSFMQMYIKRCAAEDFASLKYPVAGAEKLRAETGRSFREKFGKELLEGYGCTEMSPVVAVNTPEYDDGHVRQKGHKPGTVGQTVPGVAFKIVDPSTWETLPVGREGLLLVKGPNRMLGYHEEPELTRQAFRDGWYITGDLAIADGDGFIALSGRLSRISKIGGEMVPHGPIENALMDMDPEYSYAVTGVPDPQKGERLVVLHNHPSLTTEPVLETLRQKDFPNLWIPKTDAFHFVERLPLLGSGKLDLRGLSRVAKEAQEVSGERETARVG